MKVGYVRVSTREQDESNALEQQTARVQSAGAKIIFSDVESGRNNKRKEYNQMLTQCKQGKISEVICTRIDRLGRSVVGINKAIATLEEYKVKLNILDAPVDASSPFGWFSINQMAGLAEFESRLLSSRIKHGMDYFRGQKKASPRPPFGYCRINEKYAPDLTICNGKTIWSIAQETVEFFLKSTLRKTAQFLLDKYSIRWTSTGLRYWLTSPVLQGHTAYNIKGNLNNPEKWDIHYKTHEPLINARQYKLIQEKLEINRTKYSYGNNKSNHQLLPLEGQIICGSCGYKCFIKSRTNTYRVRCKKHDSLGDAFCTNKNSSYLPKIIQAVDKALTEKYQEIQNYVVDNSEVEEIDPELAEKMNQLQSLKTMSPNKIIQNAINETILEINNIKSRQVEARKIDDSLIELLSNCFQDTGYWDAIAWEHKHQIYRDLVDCVVVLNSEILEVRLLV